MLFFNRANMEQLIVRVADKEKAKMLSKILSALDFVNSVEVMEDKTIISNNNEQDFFSLAGLWENRNVTIESIRQEAWREDLK
jgi:superfamily II DNA/RNA helicase